MQQHPTSLTSVWVCMFARVLTLLLPALAQGADTAGPESPEFVKQLDLIHFSHTDYGFTDHPAVCRDLQRRYLDIALDTAQATRRAARRRALSLDGGNHRGGERLVAGRHARAAQGIPQGRPRRADRSHRPAVQQHAVSRTATSGR